MPAFSLQVIMGLVDVITGGSGSSQNDPIGIYRSGPVLEHFFGNVGNCPNKGEELERR